MRLTPGDEIELRWYVLESGAALGERSPLGVQLGLMKYGLLDCSRNYVGPDMDRAAAVIRRHDVIKDRLARMPRRRRTELVAAYCATVPDMREYDRLGPLMVLTKAAKAAYQRITRRTIGHVLPEWLAPVLRANHELRDEVLAEADAMLTAAVAAWENAR